MPIIKPFIATIYNHTKITNLKYVIAPPYDEIKNPEFYYNLNEYNIAKIVKNTNYKQAGNYLHEWLNKKILIRLNKEAIYLLEQKYNNKTRYGFIALLKLEELYRGKIYPHERTYKFYKEDRLNLLRECFCDFSPIFVIYSDKKNEIFNLLKYKIKTKPYLDTEDIEGVTHRVWQVTNKDKIKKLINLIKNKDLIIADGHHRYQASLRFSKEVNYNFVMCYFTNIEDKNLTVFPTHRVVKVNNFKKESFFQKLEKYFYIEPILSHNNNPTLKIYIDNTYYRIKFKKDTKILDVDVLHNIIFKKVINVDEIYYTREIQEGIDLVNSGRFQILFLTNIPNFNIIKKMIKNKKRILPQKTTYFYPKLPSGLIMNKF